MKFKKISYLVLIGVGTFFISRYIQSILKKPPVAKIAYMTFDKTEHDFFNLKKDQADSVYFVYRNTSKNPLKIEDISSRCGCTIPIWSKKELMPNQKDSILVSYDAKEDGYFSKGIYIISNSETSPDVLYIKGTVIE